MIETSNKKENLKKHQLLLEGPEKEFIDYGKIMAPNSKLVQKETELGELIKQEELAEKTKTVVLSRSELIKELCKYNLAIVRMKDYKGDFDVNYLKNVKEFMTEKELSVSDFDLRNLMFAIYPKKPFFQIKEKYDNVTPVLEVTDGKYMYSGCDEKNPTVLFAEDGFFHVVHKGRNYKNLFNLRRGLLYFSNIQTFFLRLTSFNLFTLIVFLLPTFYSSGFDILSKALLICAYLAYNIIFTFVDDNWHENNFNNKLYEL